MTTNRRDFLLGLASVALAPFGGSCKHKSPSPKILVGFVDISASVQDYGPYRSAWSKIVDRIGPGDRVVLGPIFDRTLTDFRPFLDCEVPTFNYWEDVREDHEETMANLRSALAGAIKTAEKMPRSRKTDIMNALWLAGKIIADDPRRPVIVLFSDMMEDSDAADFEHLRLDDSTATRLISQKQKKAEIPDLKGAQVYVIGARASTAAKAFEVERFWIKFVRGANGTLASNHYAPSILNTFE